MKPLALLPGSPELVISADYATLRKSDLVADLETRFDALPEAAENYRRFVQDTGLDPRQDTDQITMTLRRQEGISEADFLLIAQGRFGSHRLLDAVVGKGGNLTSTKEGIRIWRSRPKEAGQTGTEAGGSVVALTQPDETTLLFGTEREVLRALDVARGTRESEPRGTDFRDLLSGVDRRAPLWAILNSSGLASRLSREIGESSPDWRPGGALSSVKAVRLMAWVGRDVDLKVQVDAKDRETAGLLADLVRGALAAGKLGAKDRDPELLRILQETTVAEGGAGMEIRSRIPASRLQCKKPDASIR